MGTPRKEQRELATPRAAVFEACLPENGLALIGWVTLDKSQSVSGPISLAASMEIAPLSASPLAIRGPEGHFLCKQMLALSNNTDNIMATNY